MLKCITRAGSRVCDRFESCLKVSHRAGGQAQWRPGNLAAWARFWVQEKKCIQRKALGPEDEFLVWPPNQAESATPSSDSNLSPTSLLSHLLLCQSCKAVHGILQLKIF